MPPVTALGRDGALACAVAIDQHRPFGLVRPCPPSLRRLTFLASAAGHRRRGSSHVVGYLDPTRGRASETRTPRAALVALGLGAQPAARNACYLDEDPMTCVKSAGRVRNGEVLDAPRPHPEAQTTPRRALTAPRLRQNCTGSASREARADAGCACQVTATRFSKTSTRALP